jgi:hypothetical protein
LTEGTKNAARFQAKNQNRELREKRRAMRGAASMPAARKSLVKN